MKRGFKCGGVKPLRDFYPHKQMADGHLNKCKECTLSDVKRRYREKLETCKAYEKRRATEPARMELSRSYRLAAYLLDPEKYAAYRLASRLRDPERFAERQRAYRLRHPVKCAARQAVANAIRDGRMERSPCEVCGETPAEGHHDDYSRPLDVRWLCFKHHRERHGQRAILFAHSDTNDP